MSKHSVPGGDISGLLMLFSRLTERARKRAGEEFPIIAIQEAGLDGFSIHRALKQEGIESHIVDAASIMTSRRRRRAKTDRIDGEASRAVAVGAPTPAFNTEMQKYATSAFD